MFFNCRVRKRISGEYLAKAANNNLFLFQNQTNSSYLLAGSDLLFLLLLRHHFILNVSIKNTHTAKLPIVNVYYHNEPIMYITMTDFTIYRLNTFCIVVLGGGGQFNCERMQNNIHISFTKIQ